MILLKDETAIFYCGIFDFFFIFFFYVFGVNYHLTSVEKAQQKLKEFRNDLD